MGNMDTYKAGVVAPPFVWEKPNIRFSQRILMRSLGLWVMFKKAVYGFFGVVPLTNTFWFDGLSSNCRSIKNGAKSWQALEVIYDFDLSSKNNKSVDQLWIGNTESAASVRNRLKMVKLHLYKAIEKIIETGETEIRILSLACGSAKGVIDVAADYIKKGICVKIMLVDIDQMALQYAWEMARKRDILEYFDFKKANVVRLLGFGKTFSPHVIEMVGLMDYLRDDVAKLMIDQVARVLSDKGVFITGNISPHGERFFLEQVVDWPMIYRTKEEIDKLFWGSHFGSIETYYEPLNMHAVVVAHKK